MKTLIYLLALTGSFILGSCSSYNFVNEPVGNAVNVELKNKLMFEGELLFVRDSSAYFLVNSADYPVYLGNSLYLFRIPLSRIKSLKITDLDDKGWIFPIIGEQLLPGITLGIVASGYNSSASILILGGTVLLSAVTFALFESSSPKDPEFHNFNSHKGIDRLRKYARYPIPLNEFQIQDLLKSYNLTKVIELE